MAQQVTIKLNLKGFRALRTSEKMKAELARRAKAIADAAGEGYTWEPSPGRNRARATVFPETTEARLDNARNLTLLRSLDAGRR